MKFYKVEPGVAKVFSIRLACDWRGKAWSHYHDWLPSGQSPSWRRGTWA